MDGLLCIFKYCCSSPGDDLAIKSEKYIKNILAFYPKWYVRIEM